MQTRAPCTCSAANCPCVRLTAQRKNEELAQRASAVSEADLETARQEFETRLAAADRKVYALSKERDALRRGNEKLGAVQDLLKEKDDMITQARPCSLPRRLVVARAGPLGTLAVSLSEKAWSVAP